MFLTPKLYKDFLIKTTVKKSNRLKKLSMQSIKICRAFSVKRNYQKNFQKTKGEANNPAPIGCVGTGFDLFSL